MKKFKLFISAIMLFALTLSACGNNTSNSETTAAVESVADIEINMESLTQALLDAGVFEDTLVATDSSYIEMLTGIKSSDYVNVSFTGSTGSTAEVIAIFEAADTDSTAPLLAQCNEYIAKQTTSYADYKPAEVDKLDKAIVTTAGKYVIVCVANDSEGAAKVIADALK